MVIFFAIAGLVIVLYLANRRFGAFSSYNGNVKYRDVRFYSIANCGGHSCVIVQQYDGSLDRIDWPEQKMEKVKQILGRAKEIPLYEMMKSIPEKVRIEFQDHYMAEGAIPGHLHTKT